MILLYLESFGNPRKFARIARRVARTKPIVAVKSGRSAAGARATSSHTGALISASDVTVDSLFEQAGVIRTDTLAELFDVASLLANQPVPAGRRVAIVTNAGGPGHPVRGRMRGARPRGPGAAGGGTGGAGGVPAPRGVVREPARHDRDGAGRALPAVARGARPARLRGRDRRRSSSRRSPRARRDVARGDQGRGGRASSARSRVLTVFMSTEETPAALKPRPEPRRDTRPTRFPRTRRARWRARRTTARGARRPRARSRASPTRGPRRRRP